MPSPTPRLPAPPASLERKQAQQLTVQTQAALERQRRELADSLEEALEHVPRLLRGPVRRVLGL